MENLQASLWILNLCDFHLWAHLPSLVLKHLLGAYDKSSFYDSFALGSTSSLAVLGIRVILVQIRIRGSVHLTNGCGSDSLLQ
jgi:hypothetical protein